MKKLNWEDSYRRNKSGCWLWIRGKQSAGYGLITHNGERMLAHRRSYELYKGKIPAKINCLHKCDNPACVNPDHLFLGTQKDNIHDAIKKGRNSPPPHIGQAHRKLKKEQVAEIKKLARENYTYRKLAEIFDVHHSTIYKILNNKMWVYIQ